MRSLSIICMALFASSAMADTPTDAANYERLRDRLDGRFLSIGEASGQSLPAHIRSDAEGYIRWADATIDLGWYIGVLATELHMKDRPGRFPGFVPGRSPSQIADELHLALAALERLDRIADASFDGAGCTAREAVNGFFVRDDVPAGFHSGFGLAQTRSDSLDSVVTNNEMSQDQVWHLMVGLSLVAKLVDASPRGRDLSGWAVEQATRILQHVRDMNWQITNPACGDRTVARGAAAIGNAPGASAMINFITDGAVVWEVGASQQRIFDTLQDPDNGVYLNADNLHMAMAIVAVGGGFRDASASALVDLADAHDWWVYPLLYGALRGDESAPWCEHRDIVALHGQQLLAELGADEPRSPRPGRAEHSFTSSNRFIRPGEQAYVGPAGSAGQQYHGLDFMLLHNLRAIAAPRTWQGGDAPEPSRCARPSAPAPDAGAETDAGPDADGGPTPDAGLGPDSGSVDAGGERGSGGCASSSSRGCAASLLLLLLVWRRSRARVRPQRV